MKPVHLQMLLTDMETATNNIINTSRAELNASLIPDSTTFPETNNKIADQIATLHDTMSYYVIASRMNSFWKKAYDYSKKSLDANVEKLGIDSSGIPESTKHLFSTNVFSFAKRQNKDSESVLVVDLVTALSRLGVEKSVLDKALKMSTKPKRGNVYYEVKCVEN